jgi:SAM-dependent methyltransferase
VAGTAGKRVAKVARGDRLVWYQAKADPEFWHDYFVDRITAATIDAYRRKPLTKDDLGRILADHVPKDGKVLEAGSGPGYWLATLDGNGYDIEGVEYSEKLVNRVHEVAPDLPVRHGDVLDLDVPDGHYKTYLSFGVVEHREEGPGPFLAEAFRVVEPGGVAIIMVPLFGPTRRLKAKLRLYGKDTKGLPFFQYGFRTEEISRLVADAGFVVRATPTYSTDRMLREELPGFAWLTKRRGARMVQALADRIVPAADGHMVAVVATRP